MTKAIFLDRDGVINKERKDYVKSVEEFQIIDNIPKVIKILKEKGFVVIVITNQSAINRGLVTIETLNEIHNHLQKILKDNNTSIDDFYFCPHIPDENCQCRKPNPGMLIKAVQDHDIDMNQSFMIGNSLTDVQAAQKAGCKGILLNQNQTLLELVTNLIKVNFA
jgi:D-glycero-D-manno-heptose 1,7-bisphosphate phosphatase|tara:strand:- start:819 stop:1313 length:495 start_codon:yes stop_codon:yes gene_type:complete